MGGIVRARNEIPELSSRTSAAQSTDKRITKNERDTTMKTTTKNAGIKVTTGVKAGAFNIPNHNRGALKVKAGIKAGTVIQLANHSSRLLALA